MTRGVRPFSRWDVQGRKDYDEQAHAVSGIPLCKGVLKHSGWKCINFRIPESTCCWIHSTDQQRAQADATKQRMKEGRSHTRMQEVPSFIKTVNKMAYVATSISQQLRNT